jgi:hypothetical protein
VYFGIYTKVQQPSNLPNLRRLFVEARTEAEESAYSRNAVSHHVYLHDFLVTLRIPSIIVMSVRDARRVVLYVGNLYNILVC